MQERARHFIQRVFFLYLLNGLPVDSSVIRSQTLCLYELTYNKM